MAKKKTLAEQSLAGAIEPLAARFAGHKVMRLMGYWALVQTYGSFDLIPDEYWPAGSVERYRREFRELFGVNAEDWQTEVGAGMRAAHGIEEP